MRVSSTSPSASEGFHGGAARPVSVTGYQPSGTPARPMRWAAAFGGAAGATTRP
ncbi:hypothetical protein [Pseudarthrobacter oxydans]|uniref:hypothetical protein n=1 Tax=Pseudarthrobacter oxydans TaxID=1671 RepID=UPI00344E9796